MLRRIRHQFEKYPVSIYVNSVKVEGRTNIKFMMMLVWKNSKITGAFQEVYEDNVPNSSLHMDNTF